MSETSITKKSIFKRWWFWLIVLVVIIVIASSGNKSDNQTTTATPEQSTQKAEQPAAQKPPDAIKITATKLYGDYKANEVAADASYKGKTLEITGTVSDIKKDITDTLYVTLKGDQYFGDVQCYFNDKYTSQLASLKKGQQLTVMGKCDGLLMNVLVKNCDIVVK